MPDPILAQFQDKPRTATNPADALRLFFGVVLLLLGGAVCIGVLVTIYKVIYGPADLYLLRKLTPLEPADMSIGTPNGKITLPTGMMPLAGYGILTALVAFSTGIGVVILKSGVALMRWPLNSRDCQQ